MGDEDNTLKQLEAQRSDIINKLAKIEEKKAAVSPEVYEKVKKEYEDKLVEVEKKLAENVELVKKELDNLKQIEEEVAKRQKEIKFKLEEAELRYSIGEYDENTFKEIEAENKKLFDEVNSELEGLQKKIKWYSDFLEVKGLEEKIESEEKELEIEEHILEEKVPEEVTLDELLPEEEAVKPEPEVEEKEVKAKKPASEKGVACPKCGYINTPDSWYCEKCGAEILGAPES